jgi:hypothetical protein
MLGLLRDRTTVILRAFEYVGGSVPSLPPACATTA